MSKLQQVLIQYGANYDEIMQRFMGKEDLYTHILGMLFVDDNLKKLKEALDKKSLREAFEAGHTLKGVSANLGLTPFFNSICIIVESLRNEDKNANYNEMYENILTEYYKVENLYKQITM